MQLIPYGEALDERPEAEARVRRADKGSEEHHDALAWYGEIALVLFGDKGSRQREFAASVVRGAIASSKRTRKDIAKKYELVSEAEWLAGFDDISQADRADLIAKTYAVHNALAVYGEIVLGEK